MAGRGRRHHRACRRGVCLLAISQETRKGGRTDEVVEAGIHNFVEQILRGRTLCRCGGQAAAVDFNGCALESGRCGRNRRSSEWNCGGNYGHRRRRTPYAIRQHAQLCGVGGCRSAGSDGGHLLLAVRRKSGSRDGALMLPGGHLLSVLIFFPAVGALALLLLRGDDHKFIRIIALVVSVAEFLLSLLMLRAVPVGATGYHLEEYLRWINQPPINYHLGVDGISLFLVILTTFLTPISILASWKSIEHRVKEFFVMLLMLEVGVVGVFLSLDLFLFFLFWEVMLIPMALLIGIWGHERRIYAAIKFVLYTMAGSILMLVGIIWLYNATGTFDLPTIQQMIQTGTLVIEPRAEMLLFLAFFVAFAVKVPLFPLHTWLPDAHVEAPTAGSVMLAGVLLKMGTYGMIRFCLPLFPEAARRAAPWVAVLAIIGIIYGALVALVQPNLKKLVAYSSVSHLGFVVL